MEQHRPKIDFYLLSQTASEARYLTACRLLDKAYQQGHSIYVHTAEMAAAQKLDDMLWTFREDSFIPHALIDTQLELEPPIRIGYTMPPEGYTDILLNLSNEIPSFYKQFRRVIEVVVADASEKESARQRFRQYREQGITPITHQL